MKPIIYLLFLTAIIFGCSGPGEEINTDPTPNSSFEGPGGIYYNDDLVSTPKSTSEINIATYYTLIDTIYSESNLDYKIGAFVAEGDSVLMNWNITSNGTFQKSFIKNWDANKQKWATISTVRLSENTNGFVNIKTMISFLKNTKSYKRESTIKVNNSKNNVDFLGINFGMTRAEVKDAEMARKGLSSYEWFEVTPTTVASLHTQYYLHPQNSQVNTYYEFKDNKLIKVSEVDEGFTIKENFNDVAKYLGYKGDLIKELPITWINKGLRYTIQEKPFEVSSSSSKTYMCITYEKI